LQGTRPVTLIDAILKNERLQFPTGSLRMRFTTNHDKNAWDSPAVLKFGREGLALATVLVNTLPGVPMIYTGEEVGNERKLSLFEKVPVDWSQPRTMGDLWKKLFALRKDHKALSRGDMMRVSTSPDSSVDAFVRVAGSDKLFVVLNFSADSIVASFTFPMESLFPGQKQVRMKEALRGGRSLMLQQGMPVEIPMEGRGYKVYVMEEMRSRR
jgi:glycosidase